VCAEALSQIEEEINARFLETKECRASAMRDLLRYLGETAKQQWSLGGIPRLSEAPFLLAFLRQLQEQGWQIAQGVSLPCPEESFGQLRVLRDTPEAASSPHQRGLDGQHAGQPSDTVHFLSSLLARHAHTAWDHAYSTHAEIGFPLHHEARSRVGRLRAYGNAIVAPQAEAFVRAYREARGLDESVF
jgi:hypothetical protein